MQCQDRWFCYVTLYGNENVAFIGWDTSKITGITNWIPWMRLLQLYRTQFDVVELSWHRSKEARDKIVKSI